MKNKKETIELPQIEYKTKQTDRHGTDENKFFTFQNVYLNGTYAGEIYYTFDEGRTTRIYDFEWIQKESHISYITAGLIEHAIRYDFEQTHYSMFGYEEDEELLEN